ncbi:MAG: PEP-CTERM sorting domain-containing protein [Planctomycetes bacterium]|nr:PEP-CTERM sorting domain-containing protein [Planctomycetota bacterium]
MSGRTYTLSFNSLSPYIRDSNGNITGIDDRTTLLDDISLMSSAPTVPEPSTLAIFGLGSLGLAYLQR